MSAHAASYPRSGAASPEAEAVAAATTTPDTTTSPSAQSPARRTTLTRIRDRSRLSTTAAIGASAVSAGQIDVTELEVNRFTPPNLQFSSTFEIKNNALAIINDPDGCTAGVGRPGYRIRGKLIGPEGNQRDQQLTCVAYAGSTLTDNTREMSLSAVAPSEPGDYTYRYVFEYANTGDSIGTIPVVVTVDDSAPEDDDPGEKSNCNTLGDALTEQNCSISDVLLPSNAQFGAAAIGGGIALAILLVLAVGI